MTLRARLTLFFIGIVVVPLLAATILLQVLVAREGERQTHTRLEVAARTVGVVWRARLSEAGAGVRDAAVAVAARPSADLGPLLDAEREASGLDFLVLTGPTGSVRAHSLGPAQFRERARPSPLDLAREDGFPGVIRARVPLILRDDRFALVGGFYADDLLARELAGSTGVDVAIVVGDGPVGSTMASPPQPPPPGTAPVPLGDGRFAVTSDTLEGDVRVLLVGRAEAPGRSAATIWAVALVGLALAGTLGFLLARLISEPLQRLTAGAMAVAGGNLDTRVEAGAQGDIAHIADAFNVMTDNLQRYVSELEESRDELRRSLERLGITLRSTHDLEAMLGVVLDTAAVTLGARAGVLYLITPSGQDLEPRVAVGHEPPGEPIRMGEGIAGRAAETQRPLLVEPRGEGVDPASPVEPPAPTALAVPLVRGERTIGVLALYGRNVPQPFAVEDLDTLGSFAAQASVAIENVLLHQEAQRLSITDGLTGVWNRRYLSLILTKEIDRAQRFDRPLSVLMVDIDHFKRVNDDHGHLRGDEVLVELTRRMMRTLRGNIDTLARYGGEEFVIVLPETPREGARVVANKVRRAVRGRPFTSDSGPDVRLTVSIGVASFPADGQTADELLQAADGAMYRAKGRGRDRVDAGPAA